jgi:hypothetical protein
LFLFFSSDFGFVSDFGFRFSDFFPQLARMFVGKDLAVVRDADSSGLHVRYEKAGLIFDALPIPWNADAVIVEASVKLPAACDKQQFALQLSTGGPPLPAEILLPGKKHGPGRIFFRFRTPAQSCSVQVFWREHSLGQVDTPIITAAEFMQGLKLQMPVIQVGLKGNAAPCQTFVTTQCQSLCAAAVLQSVAPLAPAADLDLHVKIRRGDVLLHTIPITWTSELLRSKQALISALLPKPRRTGEYTVSWEIGPRLLHTQRLKAITRKQFLRSLRITTTRFIVQRIGGELEVLRSLPQREGQPCLDGIARVGPYFYVCSAEAGMAGLASFTLTAVPDNPDGEPLTISQDEIVVTDGPTPILPATMAAADVLRIKQFVLTTSEGTLGVLPLAPALSADLTGEGGFAPLDEFLWSPAAEEQLNDRLGKLLEDG